MNALLDAALSYAARGWSVFPCAPDGKHPITENGFKDGTTDPEKIKAWWSATPRANIGVNLLASGLLAVDADTYKPDCEWAQVAGKHDVPVTLTQRSARGGTHFIFEAQDGAKYQSPAPGVDLKHKGYILLEPSTFEGGTYRFQNADSIAPAPEWLKRPERTLAEVMGNAQGTTGRTLAEVEDALRWVNPDMHHDLWVNVLMGLHNEFGNDAIQLAEEWSARAPHRYQEGVVEAKFASFTEGGGVTVSTVFDLARKAGADLGQLRARHFDVGQFFTPIEINADTGQQANVTIFDIIADREREEGGEGAEIVLPFKAWAQMDLAAIPAPAFVYSDFYARGYTSLTVAPPKVGKSMLGLAETIDMATGRGILTGVQREPLRVVYYNAEDDQDVINSRVAALLVAYGIDQSDIEGRLFATSGVQQENFYLSSGPEAVINEPLFLALEAFLIAEKIDAIIFDPLQDMTRSPETNDVFRILGQRLRRMASVTGVAIGIVHHTRKLTAGVAATIDDARGGGALRGTARFNRLLIGMSAEEATKAGVENHRHYLRVGDAESNLAPPSSEVNRWFEKVSVPTPNGHSVGAIKPWQWPDALEGMVDFEAGVLAALGAGMENGERYSERAQDKDRWAGNLIVEATKTAPRPLNVDQAKAVLKDWLANGIIETREYKSPTQRKNRNGLYVNKRPAQDIFG